MNKSERKFYARLKRITRWHTLASKLSDFEGVINDYDAATPEEIRKLKFIHERLYECYRLAKNFLEEIEMS